MIRTAVKIDRLTKIYRKGIISREVRAVNELSLSVEKGSVVGLIGPNGAGKTTTIYCMLGLLIPDAGDITVLGRPPADPRSRQGVGFQSEIFHTYDFLKPVEALRFYSALLGMNRPGTDSTIHRLLERIGLGEAVDRKIGTFSKGMKQRLGMAHALLNSPELLILDEPFTGLDPQGRKQIADIVAEEKKKDTTVFFSSHILSDVERLCDEVIMIRKGEVVLAEKLNDIMLSGNEWIIRVSGWSDEYLPALESAEIEVDAGKDFAELTVPGRHKRKVLKHLVELPVEVLELRKKARSLEDLYLELDRKGESDGES